MHSVSIIRDTENEEKKEMLQNVVDMNNYVPKTQKVPIIMQFSMLCQNVSLIMY